MNKRLRTENKLIYFLLFYLMNDHNEYQLQDGTQFYLTLEN